jgi:hypothetical protein
MPKLFVYWPYNNYKIIVSRFFYVNYFSYISTVIMEKEKVQIIIDYVYPKVKAYYGISKYHSKFPEVKLHHNIYARLTGEEEAEGECSPAAEYDRFTNTIWIYFPEAIDEQWVIGSILHEYTHYLQDGEEMKRMYDEDGYEYDTHPFEIEAIAAEKNWHLFAK